jgi:O-succinylbenzoic acid--CoA ligase
MTVMREVLLDGAPAGVAALTEALAAALAGGEPVAPLDAARPDLPALRAVLAPRRPVEPDTAVIIATSGSTGEAKGVLLSATALRASATATHDRLGGPGSWLLATPAQYVGGLQVLTRSLLADTEPGLLDLSVPFHADGFAAAAAPVLARPGRHYTALVPTQLARLLDQGGAGLAAAQAFDAIVLGAAATTARLRERFEAAGVRAIPSYGMSETASGCVYDGRPLDPVRVRLAEPDEAGVGRIEFAGPVLAHGYRLRPPFTDEWFATGDAGRFGPDGRLEVLGRTDDLINTGGVKIAPVVVERALTEHAAVTEACVLGVPDEQWGQAVVAVVATGTAAAPAESALRDAVRAAAGRAAVPKRIVFTDALPLRGPGKPDRAALRALFAAN